MSTSAPLKYELIPLAKNKVVLRLENIGDLYDAPQQVANISIYNVAYYLYS